MTIHAFQFSLASRLKDVSCCLHQAKVTADSLNSEFSEARGFVVGLVLLDLNAFFWSGTRLEHM